MKDMIMTDITQQLTALQALSEQSATLLPETSSILKMLVKDLTSVVRLDLPRDRTLLAVDLPNLIENVNRIIKIRAEGHDPEEMETAIVEITALAADMRSRAVKAIRNEAGDIAISSSVAAMRVDRDEEPQDVTREFRLITAVPQPANTDAPGIIVNTPNIGNENAFGRITGDFIAALINNDAKTAQYGGNVLPQGSIARFEDGDVITVFTQGMSSGGRFDLPKEEENVQTLLVESGEKGFVIHGPAVISVSTAPKKDLHLFQEYYRAKHHALLETSKKVKHKEDKCAGITALGFFGIGIISCMSMSLYQDVGLFFMVFSSFFVGAFSFIPGMVFGHQFGQMMGEREIKKAFLSAPEILKSNRVPDAARAFMARHALSSSETYHTFGEHDIGIPKGMPNLYSNAVNILPARKMEAAANGEVSVMKPLIALPAPSLTDVVVPFTSLEKSRA